MNDYFTNDKIGQDVFGEVVVSTIFFDLHDRYNPSMHAPYYETMVFNGKLDGKQLRYVTKEEAIKGHKELCERVKEAENE